jgi:hypothetical protein
MSLMRSSSVGTGLTFIGMTVDPPDSGDSGRASNQGAALEN